MDTQEGEQEEINSILNKMEPIVNSGNLETFKDLIHAIHKVQNKTLLSYCYNHRGIDLISLICEHSNKKFLTYLLHRSHILHYLVSDDKCKQLQNKETAFYFAMRSNNFEILEILYDYWSGDLHWLGHKKEYNEFDVVNLDQLNNLLINAFKKYEALILKKKKVDRCMMFNIQSLVAFNNFQREIYETLNKLKGTLNTWEDESKYIIRIQETYLTRSMILAIIDTYEKHSKKEFCEPSDMNLSQSSDFKTLDDFVDENPDDVECESSVSEELYLYASYEVYYRKLDSNICLLILDHLHLLKLRLSMPQDSYQKLENKLYQFHYHVNNNWRLYLPRRRKMIKCNILAKYKDILCHYKLHYDSNKWANSINIMYYERRDFVKTIKTFKNELKYRHIDENVRKEKNKLPNEDHNYLKLVPELRDDYSLKMMSRLIGQLYSVDINTEHAVLLIERTLQIVGEFLKSSDESLHLDPSTEALLKAETSVEIINDLKKLRNMLCHAKKGTLLKRIDLEKDEFSIFKTIRNELLQVKRKIDKVIKIQKPLVKRALLLSTKSVLCDNRTEMPAFVTQVFNFVLNLLNYVQDGRGEFLKRVWTPLCAVTGIIKEAIMLLMINLDLQAKITAESKLIRNNVINEFPFYRNMIERSLYEITEDKKKWIKLVKAIKDKDSTANLSDFPNENDANRMKSYSKKHKLSDEANKYLEGDIMLFANIRHHWKFIENLLVFIVIKTGIFQDTAEDLEIRTYLTELKEYDYKMNCVVKIVNDYLDKIEERLDTKNKRKTNANIQINVQFSVFSGIKQLTKMLSKPNFLTREEKKYLKDTLKSINTMSEKIEKDIAISMKTYSDFIASEELDDKTKKVLMNLVMGRKRDPLVLHCLKNRISILKEVTADLTVNQLVLRYKLDKTFRVLLEILLFDIFDILEGNNKNTEVVKKSSKLLMEINLRNILTHGSPLLEVVGVVLDSNDLPTELVMKAVQFIEDKTSVEALYALKDSGYFSPKHNSTSVEQQAWNIEFKKSPRWKNYMLLVPEYKQTMYKISKKIPTAIDKSTNLLKAVQEKDYLLVQQSIDEGADVNFIGINKKAAIHYAAMEGDINIIKMLVNNAADINIRNEENNLTALHYSAMYNFKDAVEFLLENKADCLAVDGKGRTPLYLANQSKFLDISKVLLREMRKVEMKRCELLKVHV